jgi:CheY-like chemotaxis protein
MEKNKNSKGNVFIVEDDMLLSLVEERLLIKLGYTVIGKAVSGEEAVSKIREAKPDAILMDISLSGEMDGIDTMTEIRNFSSVPVVYLSGNSDQLNLERAKKTRYVDYLVKPITEHDLVEPLKRAMKSGYKGRIPNRSINRVG